MSREVLNWDTLSILTESWSETWISLVLALLEMKKDIRLSVISSETVLGCSDAENIYFYFEQN